MADRQITRPSEAETRFGSTRPNVQGILMVQSGASSFSVFALQDSGGDTKYLWIDSTGDVRTHTSLPTTDTDGTVVGTQS